MDTNNTDNQNQVTNSNAEKEQLAKMAMDSAKTLAKGVAEAGKATGKVFKSTAKVAGTTADVVSGTAKIMPILLKVVLPLLLLSGAAYIAQRMGAFDKLGIDKTANVVQGIKAKAELVSVCYHDQFVIQSERERVVNENAVMKMLGSADTKVVTDKLVYICSGKVYAGFDLKKLADGDITAHGDTIFASLPAPEILEVAINPSDFKTFVEEGTWSFDEAKEVKVGAKERLMQDAEKFEILNRAKVLGVEKFENLCKSFGFSVAVITVKEASATE